MTTPTTQPDRCEQIAREIFEYNFGLDGGEFYLKHTSAGLISEIRYAIQAAKQQGREEAKSDIESLQRQVACQKADYETTKELLERCTTERLSPLKQQPKSEPSQECKKEAEDILFVRDKFGYEAGKRTITELLQSKQDEMDALREEVRWLRAALALRDKLKEK